MGSVYCSRAFAAYVYYNSLDAENGKNLIIFENSAHLPIIEEKEKYQDLLVNVVLKESQNE